MKEFLSRKIATQLAGASNRSAARDRARQGRRARASTDGFTACHVRHYGCWRSHQNPNNSAGFTLVEMIAVIVLLSFGLIAGTQLITMTAQSYRESTTRVKLTQDARFAIERISRELRDALPGSVRESSTGECIEWVPVVAASRYLNLPLHTPAIHFTVMQLNATLTAGGTYFAAIFPVNENAVYNGAAHGAALYPLASNPVNAGGETDTNTDEIYLPASTTIVTSGAGGVTEGTVQRIFFTSTPVAVCARDGMIYRFSNYDFVSDVGALTGGVPLVANVLLNDGGAVNVFSYNAATQTRNAMVQLDLRLRDNNETLKLAHTVFIRNAP